MLRGFKNFLMRGDVIVVAIGLIVALAFSTLIKAFTDYVINPIIARAQGGVSPGLGWQLGRPGNNATYLNIGAFISALIYFLIFMAVVYFLIVVPYKRTQARRGLSVFGDPQPARTCPPVSRRTCPRPPPSAGTAAARWPERGVPSQGRDCTTASLADTSAPRNGGVHREPTPAGERPATVIGAPPSRPG